MESLYANFQVADSQNQYNPFRPGRRIMDQPCDARGDGRCVSRVNFEPGDLPRVVQNPPPEESEYLQVETDPDVRARPLARARTIGADDRDMSRGHMLLPSASEMPIVRRAITFDTRCRDPVDSAHAPAQPVNGSSVAFRLDRPVLSVSRICVHSAVLPICVDPVNADMALGDCASLSIGLDLPDRGTPLNEFTPAASAAPSPESTLACVPLLPAVAGAAFAVVSPGLPPHHWYVDFLKPIPSIERLTLSWLRFRKRAGDDRRYLFNDPPVGEVGDASCNATVTLVFYCRNRRVD